MSLDLALKNIGLYSAQIAMLIAFCGALLWALRLRAPAARLMFWQIVLAVCILLPLVASWRAPVAPQHGSVIATSIVIGAGQAAGEHGFELSWQGIVLGALALGVVLRLSWLAFGFLRLRSYKRSAERLNAWPAGILETCASLGVLPELLISNAVASPVTFGLRRPAILLPAGFLDLEPAAQRTIICHEALHVRRGDWGFAVAEEIVRALLWFHPAVWWLLGQLQLAREQAVDRAVVEHTRSRDEYLGALLAIASGRCRADLAMATLFLKKRHLKQRVAALTRGVVMSKRRIVVSMIAALSALPGAVALVVWQLPLIAAPQVVGRPDAADVQIITGPYKLLHRNDVNYPPEQEAKGVGGDVVVTLTLNSKGEVVDARVVSGPEALRKPVLESVMGWHFAPDPPPPSTLEVTIRFTPRKAAGGSALGPKPISPAFGAAQNFTVAKIDLTELPATLRSLVEQALPVHEGEIVDQTRWGQMLAQLQAIDEHLQVAGAVSEEKYVGIRVFVRPPGEDQPAGSGELSEKRIKLSADVLNKKVVHKVTPEYPLLAKQAKVQGEVRLKAIIAKDGRVKDVTLISGHPLLVPAAVDAVRQWVYRTTLLNGAPVEVSTEITLHFTLADVAAQPQL